MIFFKELASSRVTYALSTIIMLFNMGGLFAIFPAESMRTFGTNGNLVYGFMFSAFAFAALVGPLGSKALLKHGTFQLVYRVYGMLPLIAFALSLLLPPKPILLQPCSAEGKEECE